MSNEAPQMDMQKALFMNLIVMLSATAMQQLGKVMNPITQKVERDLQGAQATIDMVAMLQAKTQGNLDDEESKLVQQTLSALQMNYVETANEPGNDDGGEDETADDAADDTSEKDAPDAEAAKDSDEGGDSEGPKYHKSYD